MPTIHCCFDKKIPIEQLKPHPRNPNTHPKKQVQLLAKIIKKQGWRLPIVVSKRSGYIVKGHARLMAAQELKETEVPVDFQSYQSEEEERADLVADNRIAELAEIDMPMMKDLLEELDTGDFDMDLTGFLEPDLEELMTQFHTDEAKEDDFDVDAELEKPAIAKIGDIWLLGEHRVMCGDSTKKDDVEALMAGVRADMVFTDPPYGINVVGKDGMIGSPKLAKGNKYLPIVGDDKEFEPAFLEKLADKLCIFGGQCFANKLPNQYGWLVWDKREGVKSNNFADCELMWTNFKTPPRIYRCLWQGMIKEGESGSRCHPTQKPLKLLSMILGDYSKQDQLVLDPFLGSGSTLIACEQLNRVCYGMEIEPKYVDVVVKRWEEFTGKKATLNGKRQKTNTNKTSCAKRQSVKAGS